MAKRDKPRNFHACHPIMRKGGVHEKTKGAKRAAVKRETRRKASEWFDRSYYSLPTDCTSFIHAAAQSCLKFDQSQIHLSN